MANNEYQKLLANIGELKIQEGEMKRVLQEQLPSQVPLPPFAPSSSLLLPPLPFFSLLFPTLPYFSLLFHPLRSSSLILSFSTLPLSHFLHPPNPPLLYLDTVEEITLRQTWLPSKCPPLSSIAEQSHQ